MATKETKKSIGSSFALQAAILAGAGIFSRIIGVLYRSPLYHIIGDEGNGYYGTAYAIYAMVLMISTYSIPIAVSKLISGKLALGEYRNAERVFACAMAYVVVVGGLAAGLTYVFAPTLVSEQPNAVLALQILAPTIFMSGILATFRGYLQAYRTMVPTSVSQILEQVANAVVSVVAAYLLSSAFVAGTSDHAKYGAAGSAMGTGAGVIVGIIVILVAYAKKRPIIREHVASDPESHVESYKTLLKQITFIVTPIIVAAVVYNVITTLDMKIFYIVLSKKSMDAVESANLYGIFSGQYTVMINLPVAIASAIGTTLIPNISSAYTKGDKAATNHVYGESMNITMLVTIPCAVGIGVLSKPIINLLFAGAEDMAATALTIGCISVVFYSLSTLTNSILQGIGRVMEPVKSASLALVIHLVFLAIVLAFTNLNLYALVLANIVYSLLVCIFNNRFIRKNLDGKINLKKVYGTPAISALLMGIVAWGAYHALHTFAGNTVSLFVAIALAAMFYFAAIIKVGGYGQAELLALPKGALIYKLAKKCHLAK